MTLSQAVTSSNVLRTQRILWGAILLSTLVLSVVGLVIANGNVADAEREPSLTLSLYAAAFASLIISFVLPRQIRRNTMQRATPGVIEAPDPEQVVDFRQRVEHERVFAAPEDARTTAQRAAFTALVLQLALSESIAIHGLVLLALGESWPRALPLFLTGALRVASSYPSEKRQLELFAQIHRARFPS